MNLMFGQEEGCLGGAPSDVTARMLLESRVGYAEEEEREDALQIWSNPIHLLPVLVKPTASL
jgi:hypothetical protein